MDPEKENFQQLRRLLKLKRYEQPPPRYFNDFSSQVIGRIKMDAHGGPAAAGDDLSTVAPWVRRVIDFFQARPAFIGGLGAAACALLVSGVVAGVKPPQRNELFGFVATETPSADQMLSSSGIGTLVNSTNPVVPVRGSLFDQMPLVHPVPVNGLWSSP